MRDIKKLIFGFRTKVTLISVSSLLLVMALSNFFIYQSALDAQFQQLRQQLMVIAQTASLSVDTDMLIRIPLGPVGMNTAEYKTVANRLRRIRDLNPSIRYIYTLRKTKTPGVWQFVVDLDPVLITKGKKDVTAYPGDKYEVSRFPEMMAAFNGPTADQQLIKDEWGTTLSGYAPLRNQQGTAVAVLGVDMDASDVRRIQKTVHSSENTVLLLGILFSVLLGIFLSSRMTARIRRLAEGIRRVSSGDLGHRVGVEGHDEIAELSSSFNQMSEALLKSRKELEEYFYRVVQSLVRMLEAKDRYTRGHSERVGVWAQRIGIKIGLTAEQAEMLRKAGELHDIGKLAVHEEILNKKGPLTEAEWGVIRRHPEIGAEALAPVCFNEIIMACVKSHHERPDGLGYPQKLKADQMGIFAQIISVADAYDAMTTTRPYHAAKDRQTAVDEIKRNTGTQFNPDVVSAFLRALEEDR